MMSDNQRLQFRLRHILLLFLVASLVFAIVFRERRYRAATETLRQDLQRANGVLAEHGLQWQLDDLKQDQVRINVENFVRNAKTNEVGDEFFAFKITINTIGPALVSVIDASNGKVQRVPGCKIEAAPGEPGKATISMHAIRYSTLRNGYATLEYSIRAESNASSRNSSYVGTIKADQQLWHLLNFKLVSGDYQRGEAIDFYSYSKRGPPRLFQLVVD